MKKSRIFLLTMISAIFIFANPAQATRWTQGDHMGPVMSRISDIVKSEVFCLRDAVLCCDIQPFRPFKTIREAIPGYGETHSWQSTCLIPDLCLPERPFLQECETAHKDTPVPEPATSFLLGSGLLAIALLRKRVMR